MNFRKHLQAPRDISSCTSLQAFPSKSHLTAGMGEEAADSPTATLTETEMVRLQLPP